MYISKIFQEVEFSSEDEAKKYKPLDWFGEEITDSPLRKDKKLSQLSSKEFTQLLKEYGL